MADIESSSGRRDAATSAGDQQTQSAVSRAGLDNRKAAARPCESAAQGGETAARHESGTIATSRRLKDIESRPTRSLGRADDSIPSCRCSPPEAGSRCNWHSVLRLDSEPEDCRDDVQPSSHRLEADNSWLRRRHSPDAESLIGREVDWCMTASSVEHHRCPCSEDAAEWPIASNGRSWRTVRYSAPVFDRQASFNREAAGESNARQRCICKSSEPSEARRRSQTDKIGWGNLLEIRCPEASVQRPASSIRYCICKSSKCGEADRHHISESVAHPLLVSFKDWTWTWRYPPR